MTTNSERPEEKKTESTVDSTESTRDESSSEVSGEAAAPPEETASEAAPSRTAPSEEASPEETPSTEAEETTGRTAEEAPLTEAPAPTEGEVPSPTEKETEAEAVLPSGTGTPSDPETVAAGEETHSEADGHSGVRSDAAEVVMEGSTPPAAAASDEEAASPSAEKTSDGEESGKDEQSGAEQAAAVESDDRLKTKLKSGQRVEVKLVQVNEKESLLDFGGTAEGTIATSELKNEKGELRVNEGDSFTAIVRKVDEPVQFTVGRGRGGDTLRMRELESAHEGKIPVPGKVKSTNKGGFEVDLQGVRAFCPFSQIDVIYCERPEDHVGNEYTFEIIAFERGGRNIVLSRRRLLEEEAKEAATKTRETLAVGELRQGTVRRLQPYGAFVDIGGVDGLVHVSEISRGHVADPRDMLKVGEKVEVKVIGIDDLGGKRERISLSMKELEKDPWEGADQKWVPGSIVKGRVVRLTDFGAFVELAPGVDGLVHISEISTERIGHPSEVLAPEQEVDARILQVDPGSRRISLSLRPENEERAPREDGGGRGRGRRPEREPESYTFEAEVEETKEPEVDVENLEYDDALELLKRKFNQQ